MFIFFSLSVKKEGSFPLLLLLLLFKLLREEGILFRFIGEGSHDSSMAHQHRRALDELASRPKRSGPLYIDIYIYSISCFFMAWLGGWNATSVPSRLGKQQQQTTQNDYIDETSWKSCAFSLCNMMIAGNSKRSEAEWLEPYGTCALRLLSTNQEPSPSGLAVLLWTNHWFPQWHWKNSRGLICFTFNFLKENDVTTRGSSVLYRASVFTTLSMKFISVFSIYCVLSSSSDDPWHWKNSQSALRQVVGSLVPEIAYGNQSFGNCFNSD